MSENVAQYQFELKEVADFLLKKQGISSGLWMVGVNFGVGTANAGAKPDEVRPSMIVSVEKFTLTRVETAGPLVIDASKLKD